MTSPAFHKFAGSLLVLAAASASATEVQVQVRGTVDYNNVQGALAAVPGGAAVTLSFKLDSTDFLSSASYPTRGYRIDLASFDMNMGGVHLGLNNPQSTGGNTYFVLRNNDPAVDGFFISSGVEVDAPLEMPIPGVAQMHQFNFSRTFSVGTALSSLDILDAVGTYGFENMSSYEWSIGYNGAAGAEIAYQSISITAVPEPASYALFAVGGLALLAGVRRRA